MTDPETTLRQHDLPVTAQRLAVLRAVSHHPHATADDLAESVRREIGTISRQSVYNVLNILTDKGIIRRIQPADSPAMQRLYELAAAYNVPILMHWQTGSYNHGFDRFHRMLAKYPRTNFIGHAQTWWANIDAANVDDPRKLYPTGKVTPGGLTDKYLRDYPNMYGDLSAGSGLGAFARDPEHGAAFLDRHQDKLMYGSDCNDASAVAARCSGLRQLEQVRRLVTNKAAERKILHGNAKRLFRL